MSLRENVDWQRYKKIDFYQSKPILVEDVPFNVKCFLGKNTSLHAV